MKISLYLGDITKMEVDAIVNAANSSLLGGAGVDGAIHDAAGIGLLEECMTLGGCETGKAKITKGYNLPAKHVIHTVGPIYLDGKHGEAYALASCYASSLDLAMENCIHSIAFPAISTGVYGYPKKEAAEIAVRTVLQWMEYHGDYPMEATFVCFDSQMLEIYKNELEKPA